MKTEKIKILITGGAGFIGRHVSCALISLGHQVRILDNLSTQVHFSSTEPGWIRTNSIDFIRGSVTKKEDVIMALDGVTHVIHLAAETGTGQSMYEINHYFNVNVQGTALLLDLLQNHQCSRNVRSVVVASSRAVYGEGSYHCHDHGLIHPAYRTKESMELGNFEPICPFCSLPINTVETDEKAPFNPSSIYGLTKQLQEQSVLMVAKNLRLNAFALRYQNVYGPGQSLKNPYTGILAVLSNLARQNHAIEVYEDGLESRDFVYIDDVVNATIKSLFYEGNCIAPLNIGSGEPTPVIEVAKRINQFFEGKGEIKVTGNFRVGDIRHNRADITLANNILGYVPSLKFEVGLNNFLKWVENEPENEVDGVLRSTRELESRGLFGKPSNRNKRNG